MKRKSLMWIAALALVILVVAPQVLMAQTGNSWTVQFFNNPNWAGSPVLVQYTPYIDYNWGTNPPGTGMPAENWTATMTTSAYFYAGAYAFNALADDEISLQIDGVTYVNTMGAGMSGKPVAVTVTLSQGYHNLVVQYRQYTGTAYAYLTWAYTGGGSAPPPPPPPPAGPTATRPPQPATRLGHARAQHRRPA